MSEMLKKRRPPLRLYLIISLGLVLVVVVGAVWFLQRQGLCPRDVRRVIFISIDTCRADYLGCYGYPRKITPNIDAVARQGILFKNVLTPVPLTLPAHASMLTGTTPLYHSIHDNLNYQLGQSNVTLAEILEDNGFTTGAIIGSFVMDSQFGLDQGFDSYNDRFEEERLYLRLSERRGGEVSRFAIDWLDKHKSERFFLFLHYYDPHMDYDPPEPFASKFQDNLYAGEIAYADYCIGQVVKKLKDLKLYDSTLVIIAGDHGEMLGEHGEKEHGYFVYQPSVRVPMLFKLPRQRKSKDIKEIVGLIDIVPTVCGLLGIKLPTHMQGKDLRGYFEKENLPEVERYVYCESLTPTKYNANALLSVVTDRWKYIQTTRPELYDLAADPQESNNLATKEPKRANLLKKHLELILEEQLRKDDSDSKLELDEETVRRLESLGYVAGSVSKGFEFDQSKDDPKDLIYFHRSRGTIEQLISKGKHVEAKRLCEKMLTRRPDFFEGHVQMAQILVELEGYVAAIPHLYQALKLKPDHSKVHNNLGIALSVQGKLHEGVSHFRQALKIRPDYAEAHNNFGITLSKLGKLDEAISHFREVVRLKPKYADAYYNLGVVLSRQGKLAEAISRYRQCLGLNPEHSRAREGLKELLARPGKSVKLEKRDEKR